MKSRAVFLLLALALSCAASAAAAQVPGLPRPQQRPRVQAPQGRDTLPRTPRDSIRAARDTARAVVQDTLIDRLLQLEGYVPVEYQADSAEYRASDRTLRLRGDSRVQREGSTITAEDSIVYREQADFVAAYGKPQGDATEGEPISGDVFYYDLATRRATVRGARTKITESATWFVRGDVTDERGQRIYAENSTFTSDDREVPAYHFKADKIMIIRNRILVGRPAYLYFRDVPVMALPFIVQDLESGRRSGVLIPEFEINDIIRNRGGGRGSRGTGREISNIGYYWAISQYLGLELAGRWRSESYTALRGDLDFNFRRRFLNGQIAFERFWETDGPARLNLNGGINWDYSERLKLAGALAFATSTEFERGREVDPIRQTAELSSNFATTRRFDWGTLSLNAERRQSIADDDVTFSPSFNLNVNPLQVTDWAVLNLSLQGRRNTSTPGDARFRRVQPTEQASVGSGVSLTIGGLTVSTNAAYDQNATTLLSAVRADSLDEGVTDTLRARELPGVSRERINFSAGTSYQIPLFASTRLSPSITFSRELARQEDTRFAGNPVAADSVRGAYGTFVAGPPRLNLGATLSTDLYGFFPGFGEYSAVRHHIKPIVTWRYSPAVMERDTGRARIQRQVFGALAGRTENLVSLGFDQTFEAKVRESESPDPVRGDSMADSARATGNRADPAQPRKVMLLSLNTTVLTYSFEDLDTLGTRFQNEEIQNTVRTDLLGGLQFTMAHDLFDDRFEELQSGDRRVRRGAFRPFLTSFNTSFSLGQNSALFRWLGFARGSEGERRVERGQTPDSLGVSPQTPRGGATFTGNNQQAGGGPWNLSLDYSLSRQRRSVRDTVPGTFDRGNSQLGGTLTFSPTRNWGVSWNTQYSLTDGTFSVHRVNLKRDLYRWQANFDYYFTPNGNTSFSFSVHLIDLPDLKADYNERSLGVDREGTNTGPPRRTPGTTNLQRMPVLPPPPPPASDTTPEP